MSARPEAEAQAAAVLEALEHARVTYAERSAVYGADGFEVHGRLLAALFPYGLTLETAEDFARFTVFNQVLTKACRYAAQLSAGGHQDSAHDMGLYAFILEAYDARKYVAGDRG